MADTKAQISIDSIGNGAVQFASAVKGNAATSKTNGNVTVNTPATPSRPAYFQVNFTMTPTVSHGQCVAHSTVSLNIPVPNSEISTPYCDIEIQAAQQIAPALRALADLVEEDVSTLLERGNETTPKQHSD